MKSILIEFKATFETSGSDYYRHPYELIDHIRRETLSVCNFADTVLRVSNVVANESARKVTCDGTLQSAEKEKLAIVKQAINMVMIRLSKKHGARIKITKTKPRIVDSKVEPSGSFDVKSDSLTARS